jgi:hypothetical protein
VLTGELAPVSSRAPESLRCLVALFVGASRQQIDEKMAAMRQLAERPRVIAGRRLAIVNTRLFVVGKSVAFTKGCDIREKTVKLFRKSF